MRDVTQISQMTTDHSSQPPPADCAAGAAGQGDSLAAFVAVLSLFAAGLALGGLAGQLDHAFSAVALVLPVVALAAYLYRQKVSTIVAIGSMAAWGLTREMLTAEPAWSILFTFTMSLLILFGTGWLIESLWQARDLAAYFAQTEPLTGLLNRNAFLSRLQLEIDRSQRREHPLAVAFLDCDHFKEWNDNHGHLAGDEVLKLIGKTLETSTRSYDALARMGGDEFAVLFPELDPELAARASRRLHEDLRRELERRDWPVTMSMGLVAYRLPPGSARDVISTADALMYEAKRLGKNRVEILIDPQGPAGESAAGTPPEKLSSVIAPV